MKTLKYSNQIIMKAKYSILWLFVVLSFLVKAQESIDSSRVYLRNAFILDFQTEEFKVGSILMEDDIIQKVEYGKSDAVKGIVNYDFKNKYIIPGLIDAHVHLGTIPNGTDNFEAATARLEHLLKNGVTTVRDMAGDARYLNYLARIALLDEISAPDIYFSALMAGASFFADPRTQLAAQGVKAGTAPWMRAVDTATNFEIAIAEAKGTGATGIKIYANLDAKVIQQIIKAAHAQGMKVWAHGTVFPAKPSELIEVDALSHATLLAWEGADEIPENAFKRYKKEFDFDIENPVYKDLMSAFYKNETILDATIAVFRSRDEVSYQQGVALTKLAYRNQVKIAVGTDIHVDVSKKNLPIIQEMKYLHEDVGMSPIDILKSATIINAETLGKEDKIGSIEVSKKANLVILNANPLKKITNCSKVKAVFKNGKVVE